MAKKVEEEAIKHRIWRFLCISAGINSYNSDMIHNIFYSWQSDLPEENNKAYIGSCLHKALSKIKEDKNWPHHACSVPKEGNHFASLPACPVYETICVRFL